MATFSYIQIKNTGENKICNVYLQWINILNVKNSEYEWQISQIMAEKRQYTFSNNSQEMYKDMKIYLISHTGKTGNKTVPFFIYQIGKNKINTVIDNGLVGWLSGKESAYDEEDAEDTWGGGIPWRRAWQPTPVLLHVASHVRRSLAGYSPLGCKVSDMTERTACSTHAQHITLCWWRCREAVTLILMWCYLK